MLLLDRICAAARVLAALLLIGVTALVSYSAIGRYFFDAPIRFAEEVTGLLMIGLLFFGIAGAGAPSHIRVGILADSLPARGRAIASWLALGVLLVFCGVFGWDAAREAWFNYQRNIKSEIVGWRLWPWAMLVPLCLVVVAIDAVLRQVRRDKRSADAGGGARDGT